MAEVIVITSGKGGVGKTTTTANIGVGLAKRGKKVALIDTDTGLRNLDLLLGLERRIVYTLVDVIQKRTTYNRALVRHKKYETLFLMPTSQVADKSAIEPEQMKELVAEMKPEFDYILIDCPAGIEQGFQTAVVAADWAIVVTMPEIAAVRDADKIIGRLQNDDKEIKLVVNRIRSQMVKDGTTWRRSTTFSPCRASARCPTTKRSSIRRTAANPSLTMRLLSPERRMPTSSRALWARMCRSLRSRTRAFCSVSRK